VKYTLITTFNESGYNQYGRRMLDTFAKTWPKTIDLQVYAEGCQIESSEPNIKILIQEQVCPDLVRFKQTWSSVPKATGDVSADPVRSRRKDAGKGFKWDAVRFSHKVYSIFHAAQTVSTPWIIWIDADTVCHSPIPESFVDTMCPDNVDLCYLGRRGKFSECGLYAMQLHTKGTRRFLKEFQRMYDEAEQGIFLLDEWHDSFVFDAVRLRIEGLRQLDWAAGIITGEGHPLINSAWGAYLDHLKGNRKETGKSLSRDLKVRRTESYWNNLS
jgi:hypothetical protein